MHGNFSIFSHIVIENGSNVFIFLLFDVLFFAIYYLLNSFLFRWSLGMSGREYSVSEEVVKLLKKSFFRFKEESEIFKRVYLIGCALNAVQYSLQNKHPIAKNLIRCLCMYLSATRDPFLSTFEVRNVLYIIFIVLNKLYLFEQYSQEFDKLMPGCPAKTEPRSLIHLARCQVRQNLKLSNCSLPAAMNKLGLPKNLKSFVVGNELVISKKNGKASPQNAVKKSGLLELLLERVLN